MDTVVSTHRQMIDEGDRGRHSHVVVRNMAPVIRRQTMVMTRKAIAKPFQFFSLLEPPTVP